MIIKTRKLIVTINVVGFSPINFHKLSGNEYCIFKGECRQSQRINKINHKLWIIMEKSGKIRSCHCARMAGIG